MLRDQAMGSIEVAVQRSSAVTVIGHEVYAGVELRGVFRIPSISALGQSGFELTEQQARCAPAVVQLEQLDVPLTLEF